MNTTLESYWLQCDSLSLIQNALMVLVLAVSLESILPGSSAQTTYSKIDRDSPCECLVTFRTLDSRPVLDGSPESSLVFRQFTLCDHLALFSSVSILVSGQIVFARERKRASCIWLKVSSSRTEEENGLTG
jgi:hypothetical protein